jgi:tetratricopeptide (TPR) repeat protein
VVLGSAAALVVAALAIGARDRARVWRDDLTLFSDMLRTSPGSALVHANLGIALYDRDRLDEAVTSFRRAIALQPTYAMAHNNLAAALERQGHLAAAAAHYATALDFAPGLLHAERNLGHLLVRLGRGGEGLTRLESLARRRPDSAEVLVAAADALRIAGDAAGALAYLERARLANPSHAPTYYLLGKIRFEDGHAHEAAAWMQRFLALVPPTHESAEAARRVIAQAEAARGPAPASAP